MKLFVLSDADLAPIMMDGQTLWGNRLEQYSCRISTIGTEAEDLEME